MKNKSSTIDINKNHSSHNERQYECEYETLDMAYIVDSENNYQNLIDKMGIPPNESECINATYSSFYNNINNFLQCDLIDCILYEMLPKLDYNICFKYVFMYPISYKISQIDELNLLMKKDWLTMISNMMKHEIDKKLCLFDENDLSKYGFDTFHDSQYRARKLEIIEILNEIGRQMDLMDTTDPIEENNEQHINGDVLNDETNTYEVPRFIRLFVIRRIICNYKYDTPTQIKWLVHKYFKYENYCDPIILQAYNILFRLTNYGIKKYMNDWYNDEKDSKVIEMIFDKIILNKFENEYSQLVISFMEC